MKKGSFLLLGLIVPILASATLINGHNIISGTAFEGYELIARSCKDVSCVQQNIQLIDSQIADLIARRLAFVKRGAELKNSAVVSDNTHLNPNMITEVTRQAQVQGIPPEISQAVFKELDRQSLAFEKRYQNTIYPKGSPNTFSNPTQDSTLPGVTPSIVPGGDTGY